MTTKTEKHRDEPVAAVSTEDPEIQSLKHDRWILHHAGSIEIAVCNHSVWELLHEVETLRLERAKAIIERDQATAKMWEVWALKDEAVKAALATPPEKHRHTAEVEARCEMVKHVYQLEWIAAARPPIHPEPMTGRQGFATFEKAVTFMSRQAADAQFVSLRQLSTTERDLTGAARSALAAQPTPTTAEDK